MTATAARTSFLRACTLDVAVRKPGNVSLASPGHGMTADQFLRSAQAAAEGLFALGTSVGERIESAVDASWAAAGCNTNLGIVLLCAPIARAAETLPPQAGEAQWRQALAQVLEGLGIGDAQAAYRAIVRANPGGLGRADAQDVHEAPQTNLRDAMALAAGRDRVARQYARGFDEVFDVGLAALPLGFSMNGVSAQSGVEASTIAGVQRLYLAWLASGPDSHIVRKHGEAVAQNVIAAAQAFLSRKADAGAWDRSPAFVRWDEQLKAGGHNPGTSADLTVATLMLAGLCRGGAKAR